MNVSTAMLSLLPGTTGTRAGLFGLLSAGTRATGATNPIAALRTAVSGEEKGIAAAALVPQTRREIAAFRAAVASARTPAELLANPQARKVLLTANGLGSQADLAGLATKALLSDTTRDGSLASKLSNTQWLATAKAYDFANQGMAVLKKQSTVDAIADGYAEVRWRETLDEKTPGLSNAIDFRGRAGTVTTALQILGDSTLRTVVTTALGIPRQIAFQSLDAQQDAITRRLDITRLKDPAFVESFTRRYLIAAATAAASTTTTTTTPSLFA